MGFRVLGGLGSRILRVQGFRVWGLGCVQTGAAQH